MRPCLPTRCAIVHFTSPFSREKATLVLSASIFGVSDLRTLSYAYWSHQDYTVKQKTGACLDKAVCHGFGKVITHLQARSSIVSSASDLLFVFLKTVSILLVPSTHCLYGYQIAITGGLCCPPQRSPAPLRFSYELLGPLPLSQTLCNITLASRSPAPHITYH